MTWREVASFFVAGDPKAQPRQRHRVSRSNKTGNAFVQNFTPRNDRSRTWKDLVALEAEKHLPVRPLTGPLLVSIVFRFRRPKSHLGTGKNACRLKPSAPAFHTSKPDRDNLDKAVLDILTQIGFWEDDSQVVGGEIWKFYADPGVSPGAEIQIRELTE